MGERRAGCLQANSPQGASGLRYHTVSGPVKVSTICYASEIQGISSVLVRAPEQDWKFSMEMCVERHCADYITRSFQDNFPYNL